MSDAEIPPVAVSVSPEDRSSDRIQADADSAAAHEERVASHEQAQRFQEATSDRLDELIRVTGEADQSNTRLANATESMALAMVEYQERAKLAAKRDADTRDRDRRMARNQFIGFCVIVVVMFVAVVVMLWDAKKSRDQLADCIQRTGQCYKDGQKRTAGLIGQLISGQQVSSAVGAACALEYEHLPLEARIDATVACVQAHPNG